MKAGIGLEWVGLFYTSFHYSGKYSVIAEIIRMTAYQGPGFCIFYQEFFTMFRDNNLNKP